MHQHHRRNLQTAIHLMSPNRHQLNYQKSIYLLSTVQRLTSVQKFHYLRSSLTIRAARSIQSLDITEINCSIAIGILKEKFDCHLQVCMRHWHLICDYPQITTETPEAVEDFLETIKVNLRALEILGEPATWNVVFIKMLPSTLPSSTIREWQHTLPNKRMPYHTRLIDFLTTRANGDQDNFTSKETKGTFYQRPCQRPRTPLG